MNNLSPLEERLIKCNDCIADDNYISDGVILVSKNFIRNEIIKYYKTTTDNIMNLQYPKYEPYTKIPYEKGEEIILTDCDTKCRLCPDNIIGIDVNESECVNYDIVRDFVKTLTWEFPYFTILPYCEGHLIKVFVADDKFVGCFPTMKFYKKR